MWIYIWVCVFVCVLIIIMLIIARIANASLLHCVAIITNFQDGYFSWLYTLIPVWHTIFAAFVRSLDANELPIPFTSLYKTTPTITYILYTYSLSENKKKKKTTATIIIVSTMARPLAEFVWRCARNKSEMSEMSVKHKRKAYNTNERTYETNERGKKLY